MTYKQAIGLLLCLWLAACATKPAAPVSNAAASNQPPPGCVAETATRLPVTAHQCAAFGRTWTQQDIKSTGAVDVGKALSLLDPAVSNTGFPH